MTSNAVTASPTASMSPTANQQSPSLETQQSMDIDCLSTEGGSAMGREVGSCQDNTGDEGRDKQNMAERFVCFH